MRSRSVYVVLLALTLVGPLFAQLEKTPRQGPQSKTQPGKPAVQAPKPGEKAAAAPNLADFEAFVQQAMKDWQVPGVAIAIVKDGKVILSKAYGLRDVQNNQPLTTKSLFPIASITKSFTVATLATLSTEGKLDWDKPVRDYLPEFRLDDDVLTARVTPRDLVTHRTGLPRHDAAWYHADLSRPELVGILRYMEKSKDLRQQFQYNNLMYMTAGYVSGKLNGSSWEDAVRQRIFQPLGMTNSNFSVNESKKSPDYAHAYQKDDNEVVHEIPIVPVDDVGPAGSINSNLEDMTQYLLMYLNKGKHGDKQIISPSDIRQMTTPQMVIATAEVDKELGYLNYGMGFFITSYRGHKFVQHGGNLDGFSLLLSFLPDDNLGSVVLTNMDATQLREVLTYNIYDRLLGLDQVDWNHRLFARYKAGKESEKEAEKKNYIPRVEGTKASRAIDDYVGEYRHPAYGTIAIERSGQGDDLKVSWHGFTSVAKHWHYEVWRVPRNALDRLERTQLMFNSDWDGNIASLSSPLEPQVKDIVFTRQPDRRMKERPFLEPLAGTYAISEFKFQVTLRPDNVLTLTTPRGALYELEPVRGTTFAVKGLSGTTLTFKSEAGKVTEAAFAQPGSTIVLKRQ